MELYPEIIFDAERMKYAHTGIYHYCMHLGTQLLKQQHVHGKRLGIYLPPVALNAFGNGVYQLKQNPLHKFRMPRLSHYKVWHTTYQGTNYFPWGSKQKIAITIHDLNFLYEKSKEKQQKYLGILQKKIARADVNTKQISVIHNGCNIPEKIVVSQPSKHIDFPFVFTIGAITPKKNFHILPATVINNNHHLVIAGVIQNKDYFNRIMEEAAKLGVEKKVHYVGSVTEQEKYWFLQNCSLFAFPSLAEGFGLPVVEAMRFGKPVLLSTATSLPEIGGNIAFYLNSFEAEEIANKADNAIMSFTTDMAHKSIDWSYQFSWENAASSYWKIYEKLCND
jgi:glycosyltransferase involved in cell wall biosynthesis